jgi:multidrug efflux pump subunit AcrB
MDKDKLVAQLNKDLTDRFPGVDFSFSQIIEDNVAEAASGVKGANSVKLFGPDLDTLQKIANQIKDEMSKVRGIADLGVFQSLGQPTVRIDVDREKAGRYGLTPMTSTRRLPRRSAGRRRANCTNRIPTGIFRSSCVSAPNNATASTRSATSPSPRPMHRAA